MIDITELSFDYKDLTFLELLNLRKINQTSLVFVKRLIDKVTTLDAKQISSLTLSDAFGICSMYLTQYFGRDKLTDKIMVQDILHLPTYDNTILEIGHYRFEASQLTLGKAIEAEALCHSNNHSEYLGLYLLGATCIKGIKEGYETLANTKGTHQHIVEVEMLSDLVENGSGLTKINFLVGLQGFSFRTKSNEYVDIENGFFLPY